MRRLDVYVSDDLYKHLTESKSRSNARSLAELVRGILQKSMDDDVLGVSKEEPRVRPAELMLRCLEILVELQHLYEGTLRQRGDEGVAIVTRARASAAALVEYLRRAA